MDDDIPWEGRASNAARAFARECLELSRSNPYELNALDSIISTLMTELWDNGFSQSEIKVAFEQAIVDTTRYAAGQEMRGDGWRRR